MQNSDSMIHLNGNLLCAIDTETTGLEVGKHDIWEIAIVPLDKNLKPYKQYKFFNIKIKPRRPENIEPRALATSKVTKSQIMLEGIEAYKAADMLEAWFEKLNLGIDKRIAPLGSNWPFDRDMIKEWLGTQTFDYIFDGRYRDTQAIANFVNDRALYQGEQVPYGRVGLMTLANQLAVENKYPHRALYDALTSAEVYAKFISMLRI